ncbi:unnamed protein product [Pylaiella littoralis]
MSPHTSDSRKIRAARVPYTPPAARPSAGDTSAISDKKVEANAGATEIISARRRESGSSGGQQQQGQAGKQPPCQQRVVEYNNEEARRSPAVARGETARVNTGGAENSGGERGHSQLESDSRETGRVFTSANTCQPKLPAPPGLNDSSPPKAAAATAAGSGRKPRKAWSQYVPPGRRGAGCNESVRSTVPEPKPSTAAIIDSRGSRSSEGASSQPSLNKKKTPHESSTVIVGDEPAAVAIAQTASAETATPSSLTSSDLSDVEGNGNTPSTAPEECQASCSAQSPIPSPRPAEISNKPAARETAGTTPSLMAAYEDGNTPSTAPEECQASCSAHSPSPSPRPPERSNKPAARKNTGTTPSPMAACEERQIRTEISNAAPTASEDAIETPCKDPTDGTTKASEISENVDDHDRDCLPPFKPPSARYTPPGRRRALDAEAAAAAAEGDDVSGDWMGPLWTSRAPVRVSQRERAPRDASPPTRPSPARVAGVVSGGMSAYGANISEYSEEMSREQVEACTAVVSNFPAALPPGQRDPMLQPFVSLGGLVVWPRPDEALVTFATPALARQAVSAINNRSTVLVVELLSQTRVDKRAGFRRVALARPGRPPADVSSGSRLILGALGIRRSKPKTSDAAQTRKSANSKGGVRGRGAKNVQAPPAESTDSWDM